MTKTPKNGLQARVFTLSIKPSWDDNKTIEWLNSMNGVAECYVVNHDKDQNEQGEMLEAHTHILLIYDTPRRIATIANVFGLETNFVEVVRNKVAMLRYFTHLDQPTKYRYPAELVKTNSLEYADVIRGNQIADRDLVESIMEGKDFDLIGVVPMARIRLAQSLVHNKRLASAEQILFTLREQNILLSSQVEKMTTSLERIDGYFQQLVSSLTSVGTKAQEGIIKIAEEIKRARLRVK